ncbi:MAG TPA: SpoIIE family protein phosphatase [Acidimicrobiales bacterium]|nr:SpoIIE family protein phosphatase [Acidimicrobiales bacterium]
MASAIDFQPDRPGIEPAFLPALFGTDAVGLISADGEGAITAVSPAAERILGYGEPELLGRPLHDTLHCEPARGTPLEGAVCPVVAALEQSRSTEGSGQALLRSDGTMVEVAWAVAPVVLGGTRTGGVLAFYDPAAGSHSAREAARTSAIEAANARLGLLAESTHALLSSPDLHHGLGRLARLLVPETADWVVIDLVDADTGLIERAALAHRHPELEELGAAQLGPLPSPAPGETGPLIDVLAGGPAVRITGFGPPEEAVHRLGRSRRQLFSQLGAADAITAPLRTRARTVGAITVVRTAGRRPYQPADMDLVVEVAGRAAFAVENAWLLARQQRRAEELQRALLPDLPRSVGEVALAGVYRPADDVAQVGGDWYDAFDLSDGSVALVIGDVAGHDLNTATRMGAARHNLRALACDRLAPPAEVLRRLDTVLARLAPSDLVTAVYAQLRPEGGAWRLNWATAGHPPPVVCPPGGRPRLLHRDAEPPLGVGFPERRNRQTVLEPGSWLAFYTDGLIERRGETLTVGLDRLLHTAAGLDEPDLLLRCRSLVEAMGVAGADDVALLGAELPAPRLN